MSEKEILDKIEKSAAQEKIPESIEPEQIKRKLKENQKNKVKRRSGLVHRNRKDEFIGFLAKFDLVFQERHLFIHAFFQHLGSHIIQ